MKIIIGVFDCGCIYDASYSSVEGVIVDGVSEEMKVKRMMRLHSVLHQCEPCGARNTFRVDGEVKGIDIVLFSKYNKEWNKTHKKSINLIEEMMKHGVIKNNEREKKMLKRMLNYKEA